MSSYQQRRAEIETYFDRTASDAWAQLTSTAPVSGIRATVRAGRDAMRRTLLDWLPEDLTGRRLLDAGCGTGALSVEAARRGAEVVAIDLSPTLVKLAAERLPRDLAGSVHFHVGDMLDPALGRFDHVVAMDSVIHYRSDDIVDVLTGLAARTSTSMVFTFAPQNAALFLKIAVGRLFPRKDRAPDIKPVAPGSLLRKLAAEPGLASWRPGRTQRIASAFYKSQALELLPL
jgi:magnesium-protoporphyrin O-methyltransferase